MPLTWVRRIYYTLLYIITFINLFVGPIPKVLNSNL